MNSTETPVNVINECTIEGTSDASLSLLDFRLHKDDEGLWIQCDRCDSWRHVVLARDPLMYSDKNFYCAEVKKHCGSPSDPGVDGLFYHPEYFPGNVVWAQRDKDLIGTGVVWWPALIEDAHDRRAQFFLLGANRNSESRPIAYHVTFLDTFRSGGWVSANKIIPFIDETADILRYQQQKCVITVPKRARLMTEAIERARNAQRTANITKRLEVFSFVAYVARQRGMLRMSDNADYIANGTLNGALSESSVNPREQSEILKRPQLSSKKRPRAATPKSMEDLKPNKKATGIAGGQNQKKTARSEKDVVRQEPTLVRHPKKAEGKRRLGNPGQRMMKPQIGQSFRAGVPNTAATAPKAVQPQCGPPKQDIRSEVYNESRTVQRRHKNAIALETCNTEEAAIDEDADATVEAAQETMNDSQCDSSPDQELIVFEVDKEVPKIQKRPKQVIASETCSVEEPSPSVENLPAAAKNAALLQAREGVVRGVIKRPANPVPRGKKPQFVPPIRQTPVGISGDPKQSPKGPVQTQRKQPAVLSENRAPKVSPRPEPDLLVRQSVPPAQPKEVSQRSHQNRRRSPSPYTVDWLEATYESKCANLTTDSDCDSGIADSLGRSEEYSPGTHSKSAGASGNKQFANRYAEGNADQNNAATLMARSTSIRSKQAFSLPARKPYKPSSQEGLGSQPLGSQGSSQPTSFGHQPSSQSSLASSQEGQDNYGRSAGSQDW